MTLSPTALLSHLRRLASPLGSGPATDTALLKRFADRRDEAAFAALVSRHGTMVLRVCRQVLGNVHDAEDCFQATFLVLARRAGTLRRPEALAGWLHGVALRIAHKARARVRASRSTPSLVPEPPDPRPDPLDVLSVRELLGLLHEEIARLPEVERLPVVLCCLEGCTMAEAAEQLGWSPGSLRGRLVRGRARLHSRLARRGVTLPAGVAATLLAPPMAVSAATQEALLSCVAQAAGRGNVSATVAQLAQEGLRSLAPIRGKIGFVFLLAGMVAAGIGALAYPAPQAKQPQARAEQAAPGPSQPKEGTTARTDQYGDPLPAGAIARLGTTRWCLDGHLAHGMVVSQDGKQLLTANPVTGVAVWDMATGRLTRQLPEIPELRRACLPAGAVTLSADGRTAALGGPDGMVHLLDVATGKEKQRCRGHRGQVEEAALSADGRLLATRSVDETLRVWDAVSGKQLRLAPIHQQIPDQYRHVELALSTDGKTLAWVDNSKERLVHVCEAVSGKELHRLGEHKGWRRRIAFSPDGRMLVSTSDGGPGQLWDVKTGKRVRELSFWKQYELVAAAFTPDSKGLVLTLGGDAMRLLDVQTGKEIWRVARRYSSTVLDVFAFAPDGKTLIVSAHALGPVLHRYDASTGKRLVSLPEPTAALQALAFAPDERALYSLGEDGMLRSWHAATGKELARVEVGTSQGLFSPDGRLLVAHKRGASHLYDTATVRELRRFPSDAFGPGAFSPDGKRLAVQRGDRLVLLEVATGKELCRITNPPNLLYQLAFTSGGRELVGHPWLAYERGGSVHFWDASSGRQRRTLDLERHFGSVALSPDGKTLAVPLENWKGIDFLEVATGEKRFAIAPPSIWACAIGYSPDGRLFLVGNQDGSVRFHDAYDGRLLLRREGHRGTVTGWAFSRSGRLMATRSQDRTALVWSMPNVLRATVEKPVPLSPTVLPDLWSDLAGRDAVKAHRAISKLARAPEQSLPWLKEHLKPAAAPDPKRIRALIADLDSPRFSVRENATRELEKQRELAETMLRQALAGQPSAEVRQRLEQLLEKVESPITNPERLRRGRAIEVLEQMGSSEARKLLQTLAGAVPEDWLGQEAKAALDRLAKRPLARP